MISSRALVSSLVLALAACGDDPKPAATPDTVVVEDTTVTTTPPEDTAVPVDTEPEPDVAPPGHNVLAYAPTMVGSNGLACTTSCAIRAEAGTDTTLAIVYKDASGLPLKERMITFDAGADLPHDLATLSALSAYTDEQGMAKVVVKSHGLAGSVTVNVHQPSDSAAGELVFTVTLEVPPAPALAASFEYLGNAPVTEFSLRLFEQKNGTPTCASVYPDGQDGNRTPDVTRGPFTLGQQARVAELPGLAQVYQQKWVVQFIAPPTGAPVAAGCVEVTATYQQTAQAYVYVLDLPRHFVGDYGAQTRLDIVGGAEGTTAGTVLSTLTDLFTRPGHFIVTTACRNPGDNVLGRICGWITNDAGEPNFLGEIVTSAADSALLALFEGAVGNNAQDATQLVSEMLRDLRLVSILHFAHEPASAPPNPSFDGAYFAGGDASEEWTHVKFRWKLDPRCKNSPHPEDCGWASIPLETVYGSRPTAQLSAGINSSLALNVDMHDVSLMTYGPLVNAIVERYIMPLIFDGGGAEPVDSWDDLVATLFGDRQCLEYDDCCDYFAQRLYDSYTDCETSFTCQTVVDLAPGACEIAIPLVAQAIRSAMSQLSASMHVGTPDPTAACPSVDNDLDRWTDGYGSSSAPCEWSLYFPTQSGTFYPDNDWRAVRQ